jgi:hypothetical protein
MAASFFLRGENISEDLHKLCEAADIFDLKQMLMEVRDKTIFQTSFKRSLGVDNRWLYKNQKD